MTCRQLVDFLHSRQRSCICMLLSKNEKDHICVLSYIFRSCLTFALRTADYCSAILARSPRFTTDKLQWVMNSAARPASSATLGSSTAACRGYSMTSSTGSTSQTEYDSSSPSGLAWYISMIYIRDIYPIYIRYFQLWKYPIFSIFSIFSHFSHIFG